MPARVSIEALALAAREILLNHYEVIPFLPNTSASCPAAGAGFGHGSGVEEFL